MSGPAPGSQCRVCLSPDVALINAAIASGQAGRKIATRFGLGKDSVFRHIANRHPGVKIEEKPEGSDSVDDEDDESDGTELSALILMRAQLQKEMAQRPRSDTARELRQVHQRIAEISGDDRPKSMGVSDVEGLPELIAAWFEALEKFPEARQAMLDVMKERGVPV